MWMDTAAAIAIALLAGLGFRRGALATFLQMFVLIGAYAFAWFTAPKLGPQVAQWLGLQDLLGMAAAGGAIFCGSYLVLALAAHFARSRDERERHGRSLRDRLGGAGLGILQGTVIALLLGVLASWLEAGRTVGKIAAIPDVGEPQVARFSRMIIETAVGSAIEAGDTRSRVALRLATRPAQTLKALEGLSERSEIQTLQNDRQFWAYLESDQTERAMNQPSFIAISERREIREQLVDLGMVDERGIEDSAFFRQELRMMLEQLGPRLRALRDDPELAKLASDPDVMRAIEERNTGALLIHPGVRRLAQKVLQPGP
jgi:uncharacterized membrane protein required for colicin V production